MLPNFRSGVVTGTGAAINVSLGWVPDLVVVTNYTDGDQIDLWHSGMTAGTNVQINAAVAPRASNGISAYTGDTSTGAGFTIGTGVSESAKVLYWFALRNGPGV